jgi:CheY-like chemotaxis protein
MSAMAAGTVLVVDDDPVIQRLLRINFEMEGYQVLLAGDGPAGLNQVRSARPDVVVIDVMMPGMDGLDLTAAIKSDPAISHLPVLLLSAKAQDADIRAGEASGADAYVTKPFEPLELLGRVAELVTASKGRP